MASKEWLILKSVATQDERKNKRIGHGDGGLGTVEYYEKFSEMVNDVIKANLVTIGGDVRYDSGNGCWVRATGYGIRTTRYAGGVQITIPEGIILKSFRLRGDATYLSNNQIEIKIYDGKAIADATYNQDNDSSYHPFLAAGSRNQLDPADPFVQRPHDAGGIDIFHLPITTAGICISQVVGLSGNWEVFGML